MRKRTEMLLLLTCCVALFAGACAKRELVPTAQPLLPAGAPAASAAPLEQATAPRSEAARPEGAPRQGAPAPSSAELATPDALEPVPAAELGGALETVYFDFDSYLLAPEARQALEKNARLLAAGEGVVRIAGHCDERGSDDYNLALSERRAVSALNYLAGLGVPRERLTVIGYGKEKPAAAGHDEASWALNRRDEFEPLHP